MRTQESVPSTEQSRAVDAARVAIWRLFQEGFVDEDMATAGLLAVDLGTRRAQRGATSPAREDWSPPRDRSRAHSART
jgi:hypothetical protein